MKFNCGPSAAERAIVNRAKRDAYLEQWHPFFCILPRRIGHTCHWLEYVRRKGRQSEYGYGGPEWYFEFRPSLEYHNSG